MPLHKRGPWETQVGRQGGTGSSGNKTNTHLSAHLLNYNDILFVLTK